MTLSSEIGAKMLVNIDREIKGKYLDHDVKKLNGVHYTPKELADFVSDRMISSFDFAKKKEISIFDPAVGDGELLGSLAKKLIDLGYDVKVYGYDIDPAAIEIATIRISAIKEDISVKIEIQDFTDNDKAFRTFDFIIANPPYVRTQSLGVKSTSAFSEQYSLEGRIDLYYVFLMGIQKYMDSDSVSGFIVSNRFMTTKSGAPVREGLLKSYSFKEVYDFGDTKLFEAAVLPAVLVFKTYSECEKSSSFTSVYSSKSIETSSGQQLSHYKAVIRGNGLYSVNGQVFEVKAGTLRESKDLRQVWSISNTDTDEWDRVVSNNTFCTFSDMGKIRVGVKTTADKVFIQKDWDSVPEEIRPENEALRSLITHHYADRFKEKKGNTRSILYTHESRNGKKVALDFTEFPKAWAYLNHYKEQLSSREYLMSSGRNWFEIWVPQEPSLWAKPKIVFRDICERPTFWLDTSGAIVNGDCYWFALNETQTEDDIWLVMAVANSKFIEDFYDHKFNNKLYSGRRRFMTQYVEQFPIPKLSSKDKEIIINSAKQIFSSKPGDTDALEFKLDDLIYKAFGLKI
jgi:adenine-specific DNA-methyltransferase